MAKRKKIKKIKKLKKNKNRMFLAYLLFGVGVVLAVVLIGLILISFGAFEKSEGVVIFSIRDECGVIMGNLIHQVKDKGECRIKCINECGLRDMTFDQSGFTYQNSSCHTCDCYCK